MGFLGNSVAKNLPGNAGDSGDMGSTSGSGRSLEEGNGNPLQYSCLENPVDRGVRQTTAHGVTKSQTQLSTHELKKINSNGIDLDLLEKRQKKKHKM